MPMRRILHAAALGLLLTAPAWAADAVGPALDRPALKVRAPQRSVLLAAAQAGTRLVAVGERGIVVLSDDGGASWRQAEVPTSVGLTAVRFADARTGWAVGHGGVVLATSDGGERWERRLDGRQLARLLLDDAKRSGDAAAVQAAERLVQEGPDKPLLDLLHLDGQRLLAVGAYGLALASEDGGRSWTSWASRLPNPKGLHLYAARRQGDTLLLAGEQGLVLLSQDGGHSFRRLDTPYRGSFFTAELLSEREMVLAGLRGTVLRSADAGASWSPVAVPVPAAITATVRTPDGRLLAASQAGLVLALQGQRMEPLPGPPLPPLNALLPAGSALHAFSIQGVIPVSNRP